MRQAADPHPSTLRSQPLRSLCHRGVRADGARAGAWLHRTTKQQTAQQKFASFGGWRGRPAKLTVLVPARLGFCLASPCTHNPTLCLNCLSLCRGRNTQRESSPSKFSGPAIKHNALLCVPVFAACHGGCPRPPRPRPPRQSAQASATPAAELRSFAISAGWCRRQKRGERSEDPQRCSRAAGRSFAYLRRDCLTFERNAFLRWGTSRWGCQLGCSAPGLSVGRGHGFCPARSGNCQRRSGRGL